MSDLLAPIMSHYSNYSMIGDGNPEINSLSYMSFESSYADSLSTQRLALVLIEPRLLESTGNLALRTDLIRCLQRLKGDLRAEGLLTRFIIADVYKGPVHKDGRTVLALRQFLRDVKSTFANFEGVILVGNFPEATLVKKVSWCPAFLNPNELWIRAEMTSDRAEIVLADLTGHWESLYQQNDFSSESFSAKPDASTIANGWFDGESVRTCRFSSTDFQTYPSETFRDAFFLDAAIYTVIEHRTTPSPFLCLQLNQAERNDEVDENDRSMVNILAKPDISVSRINALHIALNPNPTLTGTDGHKFLDAAGNPQTVSSPTPLYENHQYLGLFNFRDFDLERRLLISYLNRNHRFRIGAFSNLPFRTAAISGTTDFDPAWYESLLSTAATDFQPGIKMPNATLQEYVQFLKTPATLKYVMAHSNEIFSEFRDGQNNAAYTAEVGGVPLRWNYTAGQYVPTFEGQLGNADLSTHRALWHYNTLQNAGASLMIHGGCNVNSVSAEVRPPTYTSTNYAHWNNAEGILFYTNCVALLSRAKGFNDAPNGFAEGYRLTDRANFGSCWKSYFNAQANDGGISTYNVQRKRAYFWSINGDWTLRLRNKNGLGILSLGANLRSQEVHPNRAWIDGWNYDAAINQVRGIGDIDGDGIDEFVITSDWGIGLLKHDGTHFRAIMIAPRDTWFGGWRYDASINTSRDKIKGVQNFTGTSKCEIMIWSSWGITTLEYNGGSLIPSRIFANGTRLGGWLLNTADVYCGSGQFDNDLRKDMVVTSPWGLGIISLQGSTHIYMAPNGTRLGDWLFNGDTTVRLIADLDGDGMDEILVSSGWGIGILKMVGGTPISIAMHANGENLDGYSVNSTHNFALADSLKTGPQKQILVVNATGIHVLSFVSNRLTRLAVAMNGTRIDGWVIDTNTNQVQSAGDMNGDRMAEFIIRSPWGMGIMGIDATNRLRCYSVVSYNSVLNDWYLQAGDVIAGSGNLSGSADRKELLIVKP